MRCATCAAALGGMALSGVQGGIAELGEPTGARPSSGRAAGPLADDAALRQRDAGRRLDRRRARRATGTGDAELALASRCRSTTSTTQRRKGSLALAGNDVRMQRPTRRCSAARRAASTSPQKGFTVVGAERAALLGGEAALRRRHAGRRRLRFSGQGTATAEGLRRAAELGAPARLAAALTARPATASLGFAAGAADRAWRATWSAWASTCRRRSPRPPQAPLALR